MKKSWLYLFLVTGFILFRSTSCNDEEEKDPEPVNFMLTVAISPTNGGNVSRSPDQNQYASGTNITLLANPATGYQFTRWEGDATGTSGQTAVTMNSNKNVTAFFTAIQYTLAVTISPAIGGSVSKLPDQSQYASGTNVVLTANPASGYQFTRWEGDVTGMSNPATVMMNGNKNVMAVFTGVNPLIQLSKTNLTFTATIGGTAPSSQTVSITNGGTGTLSELSRSYIPAGTLPMWMGSNLNQTTAPAVLTVSVSMKNPSGGTIGAGTYSTRIAINSTNANNSPQYIDVTFTIQPQVLPRSITLINNSSTSVQLKDIVRIKVARYENGVFVRNDLLTNDPGSCLALPGKSVKPGESFKFDVTIGPDYSVFIGVGCWDPATAMCGTQYPWTKISYAMEQGTFNMYWFWKVVNVTGHQNGNWNWTVSGSYTNATLGVTPEGKSKVLFNMTSNDPIP